MPARRLIDSVPPPEASEQREMKILYLSAPRTGTSSTAAVLKRLGYRVYAGMGHAWFNENAYPFWSEALDLKYSPSGHAQRPKNASVGEVSDSTATRREKYGREEFDRFLGTYHAVGSWPASCFVEELIEAYPNAKVVLTVREKESWLDSYMGGIVYNQTWWGRWEWILPIAGGRVRDFRYCARKCAYAFSYGNPWDRDELGEFYEDHIQKIRDLVPAERLLELDLGLDNEVMYNTLCNFIHRKALTNDIAERTYPVAGLRKHHNDIQVKIWHIALKRAAVRVIGAGVAVAVMSEVYLRFWKSRSLLQRPFRWS